MTMAPVTCNLKTPLLTAVTNSDKCDLRKEDLPRLTADIVVHLGGEAEMDAGARFTFPLLFGQASSPWDGTTHI